MKRHLDPQNLPKTPSQEVFGRLGWRVFSGDESFEHRHLFTGNRNLCLKTNSPIFFRKTKQLSIAGRKIHSFHLEKGMNSPSNSGIVAQRDLGPLGSPFGGAGAGSFSPQVGRNWVLKSLSSRCGQFFSARGDEIPSYLWLVDDRMRHFLWFLCNNFYTNG